MLLAKLVASTYSIFLHENILITFQMQYSLVITLCLGTIWMDHVISELCYKATI